MTVSAYCLNLGADAIANRTISIRLHDGAPGSAGTANRIGTVSEDVAASGWSDASDGDFDNDSDISFGVLSSADSNDVSHYSAWAGSNFLWHAALDSTVTVAANESFKLNSGTVGLDGASG